MLHYVVLLCLVSPSLAVIYRLNDSDYYRMPDLYELDNYDKCMSERGGVFCLADLELYSEQPSALLTMIQEYSEYTTKHYNHTEIHRGLCITQTCADYVTDLNDDAAVARSMEACVNASLWQDYQLKGRLAKLLYCKRPGDSIPVDNLDMGVSVVYVLLILMNAIGTFYDFQFCKDSKAGNRFLLAFSMRRNYAKMVAPSGDGPDPRLSRLSLFHGMRTVTMCCVFFSHTVLIMSYSYVNNPKYIEMSYDDPMKQILYNGSLVTYTFFVMSAFLLAYNFLIYSETHPVTWWQLPKGILMRWLRLTPVYALVLFTVMSIIRHAGDGPLWDRVVVSEAEACRQYWWAHLLFINNYIYDDSQCAPQTWYLAADTQLFCIGLIVMVAARTTAARKRALAVLFVLSLIIPALHTYFQNLDAVVLQSPEKYRNLYATDDTFRLLYVRGHTNLSTYTIGLAGGFLIYHWQKQGKTFTQWWCRYWTWAMFPLGVGVILSGGLFYMDGVEVPLWFKILYASTYKSFFQIIVMNLIVPMVFKVENVYRAVVEWRGFTWTGRVSYSAFLVHTLFQRGLFGAQRLMSHMSELYVFTILSGTIFMSFITAAILWIMVEAPLMQVTKAILEPPRRNFEKNITNGNAAGVDGQTKLKTK